MLSGVIQRVNNVEFGNLDIFQVDGKEYFPASTCAKLLGYKNPQEAIRTHCKGVSEMLTPTNGGNQKIKVIPEGDLYRLIIRSKLPAAEKFEKWVFEEVLPSIRKNKFYGNLDVQAIVNNTVKMTVEEVMKQLSPLLLTNKIQQPSVVTVVEKKPRKRVKHHSIIEQLDAPLRKVVEEMICDPQCTYKDIVDYLGEAGVSITITSVSRYSRRLLPAEDWKMVKTVDVINGYKLTAQYE